MAIINMTPHEINIVGKSGDIVKVIPASGSLIRLETKIRPGNDIDGIPTSRTVFLDPVGLPDFKAGTWLIVSQLVKSAVDRSDLLVPAEMVRDENGRIIGCKSLGR